MNVYDIECLINGFGCLIETTEGVQIRIFDTNKDSYELAKQYKKGLITLLHFKNEINEIMQRPVTRFDVAFVK